MAHPGGAPTKYRPEYCIDVVKWLGQGWSIAECCAEWDIARETWRNWKSDNPEFMAAVNRGMSHGEAWWTRTSRENLENREFNTPLWKSNMANRFGWRDNKDVKESADNKLHITIKHV